MYSYKNPMQNYARIVCYVLDNIPMHCPRFILGSSIASDILSARFLFNCDILGVKVIRIDPLEPNTWLSYVSYAVLQLFF